MPLVYCTTSNNACKTEKTMISVREIIAVAAEYFGVTEDDILGRTQKNPVLLARHVAIYLAKSLPAMRLVEIGYVFRRDHTTILHAQRKIARQIKTDHQLANRVAKLKTQIMARSQAQDKADIDVIATARRINSAPLRETMRASHAEVAAMAQTIINLWENSSGSR
jgi:isopropylmalate/homocitrate/citramalate synthase